MSELGVCGACGRHLMQRVGTLAMHHPRENGPQPCEGYGIPVLSMQEWAEWVNAPVDEWDL